MIVARAPGRVNLIGDHTDHTGGFVLPMAIDRATAITGEATDEPVIRLTSDAQDGTVAVPLPVADPGVVGPSWGRYVAAVAAALGREAGFAGHVTSTVPVGAGLSSSAALLVATGLAFGADPADRVTLARLAQSAERSAVGVPCGIMDPLASVAGREGHALLIDTARAEATPVPVPDDVDVVVVHSGEARSLAGSPYAERRARCETAAGLVGSLREASLGEVAAITDPVVRAAGRHVVTENARVRQAATALADGAIDEVGRLMVESHRSLRDDLEVSTPALDRLVDRLVATPGVFGARLTGAGFGGCVVALARPGALREGWVVRPSDGASVSPAG